MRFYSDKCLLNRACFMALNNNMKDRELEEMKARKDLEECTFQPKILEWKTTSKPLHYIDVGDGGFANPSVFDEVQRRIAQ